MLEEQTKSVILDVSRVCGCFFQENVKHNLSFVFAVKHVGLFTCWNKNALRVGVLLSRTEQKVTSGI